MGGSGYGFVGVGGGGILGVGGGGLLIGLWIVSIRELIFFFFFFFLLVVGFLVELKVAMMVFMVWWCHDGGCDGDGN